MPERQLKPIRTASFGILPKVAKIPQTAMV